MDKSVLRNTIEWLTEDDEALLVRAVRDRAGLDTTEIDRTLGLALKVVIALWPSSKTEIEHGTPMHHRLLERGEDLRTWAVSPDYPYSDRMKP